MSAHDNLGPQFNEIVAPLQLEGVGQEPVRELARPRGKDGYRKHMVDDHGHDDYDENPGLFHWTETEWREQHDEDHEGMPEDVGHVHP